MKVAITGGTGLIGQAVTKELTSQGHHVFILTRNKSNKQEEKQVSFVEWLKDGTEPEKELDGIDALINLAGENLNSGRWTSDKKQEILQSRIEATKEAVRIIEKMDHKPSVFLSGSAVGFYGTSYTKTFTEEDREPGEDFLADVVKQWEEEALKAPPEVRVVCTRFGVVLDAEDGALKKMLPPFKLFAGGKLGTGEQWMSWIHIEDVAQALVHCIHHKDIQGPVNFTSPEPQRMKDFGKTLADTLNRPFWAPVPSTVLHIALGEMSVLVLEGQRVLPKQLQNYGYTFTYPNLQEAFSDLLKD
ncbi:TIGR01777 family protein [Salipaludibacillus keqinensis]|uniref:TIGR01777 family protein n=1 Tax=Salipaludibacillus keqinensis TaxID=2045207 RepID=A0A323TSK5_9BACI|nr:TIGR01777 family oxidoreductase [Salipaludibacillus keqinensis]PYZ92405.1 TIGR01777 family protein [Salipaludibacillus keqinensis]